MKTSAPVAKRHPRALHIHWVSCELMPSHCLLDEWARRVVCIRTHTQLCVWVWYWKKTSFRICASIRTNWFVFISALQLFHIMLLSLSILHSGICCVISLLSQQLTFLLFLSVLLKNLNFLWNTLSVWTAHLFHFHLNLPVSPYTHPHTQMKVAAASFFPTQRAASVLKDSLSVRIFSKQIKTTCS